MHKFLKKAHEASVNVSNAVAKALVKTLENKISSTFNKEINAKELERKIQHNTRLICSQARTERNSLIKQLNEAEKLVNA